MEEMETVLLRVESSRVVEVEKEWYVQLCVYLEALESWSDVGSGYGMARVMFVLVNVDGTSRKLVFCPKIR
jgi:hypothetical protein